MNHSQFPAASRKLLEKLEPREHLSDELTIVAHALRMSNRQFQQEGDKGAVFATMKCILTAAGLLPIRMQREFILEAGCPPEVAEDATEMVRLELAQAEKHFGWA